MEPISKLIPTGFNRMEELAKLTATSLERPENIQLAALFGIIGSTATFHELVLARANEWCEHIGVTLPPPTYFLHCYPNTVLAGLQQYGALTEQGQDSALLQAIEFPTQPTDTRTEVLKAWVKYSLRTKTSFTDVLADMEESVRNPNKLLLNFLGKIVADGRISSYTNPYRWRPLALYIAAWSAWAGNAQNEILDLGSGLGISPQWALYEWLQDDAQAKGILAQMDIEPSYITKVFNPDKTKITLVDTLPPQVLYPWSMASKWPHGAVLDQRLRDAELFNRYGGQSPVLTADFTNVPKMLDLLGPGRSTLPQFTVTSFSTYGIPAYKNQGDETGTGRIGYPYNWQRHERNSELYPGTTPYYYGPYPTFHLLLRRVLPQNGVWLELGRNMPGVEITHREGCHYPVVAWLKATSRYSYAISLKPSLGWGPYQSYYKESRIGVDINEEDFQFDPAHMIPLQQYIEIFCRKSK